MWRTKAFDLNSGAKLLYTIRGKITSALFVLCFIQGRGRANGRGIANVKRKNKNMLRLWLLRQVFIFDRVFVQSVVIHSRALPGCFHCRTTTASCHGRQQQALANVVLKGHALLKNDDTFSSARVSQNTRVALRSVGYHPRITASSASAFKTLDRRAFWVPVWITRRRLAFICFSCHSVDLFVLTSIKTTGALCDRDSALRMDSCSFERTEWKKTHWISGIFPRSLKIRFERRISKVTWALVPFPPKPWWIFS